MLFQGSPPQFEHRSRQWEYGDASDVESFTERTGMPSNYDNVTMRGNWPNTDCDNPVVDMML